MYTSAAIAARFVRRHLSPRMIIGGDFNGAVDGPTVRPIVKGFQMRAYSNGWVDHLFTRGLPRGKSRKVIEKISDHDGLLLRLNVGARQVTLAWPRSRP